MDESIYMCVCAHMCAIILHVCAHVCGEQRTRTTYTPHMPSILCYRTEIFTGLEVPK